MNPPLHYNRFGKEQTWRRCNESESERRLSSAAQRRVSKPEYQGNPFGFDTAANSLCLLNRHYAESLRGGYLSALCCIYCSVGENNSWIGLRDKQDQTFY